MFFDRMRTGVLGVEGGKVGGVRSLAREKQWSSRRMRLEEKVQPMVRFEVFRGRV